MVAFQVDKYISEILSDLIKNLTNNQWRVRESRYKNHFTFYAPMLNDPGHIVFTLSVYTRNSLFELCYRRGHSVS